MRSRTFVRTKTDKISALKGNMAIQIAAKENDPVYSKYAMVRKALLAVKKAIMKKYGAKGMRAARVAAIKNN